MVRRFTLSLLLCALVWSAHAQTPQWKRKTPQPLPGNGTYTFVVTDAETLSLDMGRKKCFQMLSLDRGLLNTVTMSYKSEEIISSSQQQTNGNFKEHIDEKSLEIITTEGKPIQLKARIVDEYYDTKRSLLSTLYQVGIAPDAYFDDVYVTDKYGGRGLWRSAIIPGWGQFHKGANLKGGLILGGTALLVGGIVYTETMRKDYMNKIEKTHVAEHKRAYATKSDNFAMGRNICIGALGALYVYNLIDAIVAPGARYVKFSRVDRSGNSYVLTPTVTATGDPAMAMAITF